MIPAARLQEQEVTMHEVTMHEETARRFILDLDRGRYGTTAEDRASALAVLLAAVVAGTRAAEREQTRSR